MKQENFLTRFLAVFMIFIISFISVAGASATNTFEVNNPLTNDDYPLAPEWADGNEYIDYNFEITNNIDSTEDIGVVKIYFPESSWVWYWWFSSSCDANEIPEGWYLSSSEEGYCEYVANNPNYRIAPGETVTFRPSVKTDENTGEYFWLVTADYVGDGTHTADTMCQIDNTDPVLGTPEVYSTNYYYDVGTDTHWVGNGFDLRSEVSDEHSGINPASCEIKEINGSYQDANYDNLPPEYCYEQGIGINNLDVDQYKFRVEDNVGNKDYSAYLPVKGDTEAPNTNDDVICEGWYSDDVTVDLDPTDGESGVANTYYCVDETGTCEPTTEGTSIDVTCAEGSYCEKYVNYYSVDNVGNQEEVQTSCLIQIDNENPWFENIVFVPATPSNDNTPNLSFDVLDQASGVNLASLTFESTSVGAFCTGISNGYECSFTLDPLAEGNHVFDFYVEDNVGNSGSATENYFVDTVAPSTEAGPLNEWQISNTFTIPYTFYDPEPSSGFGNLQMWYYNPSMTLEETITSFEVNGSIEFTATNGDGQYAFFSEGFDAAGNDEGWPEESCTINDIYYTYCPDTWTIVDTTAPEIWGLNVQYPAGQTQAKNGDEVIISVGADDENGIDRVELDAMNIGEPSIVHMDNIVLFIYSTIVNVSGTNGDLDQEITATAFDIPGNSNSMSIFVEIDNTAPVINNIDFENGNPSNDNTPKVTFDVSDSDSGVDESTIAVQVYSPIYEYFYPADISCTETEGVWSCELTTGVLADGLHEFVFYATDMTGNEASESVDYYLDSTGPVITAINVDPNPTAIDPYVTAEATDELTNIEEAVFYVDHDYGTPYSMEAADGNFDEIVELIYERVDISELNDGVHLVEVKAKDAAQNWGELVGITFIVDRTVEPMLLCPIWSEAHIPWFLLEDTEGLGGDYSVENVLYSIDGAYDMVYYFNDGAWYSYMPGREINDLETMYHEEGAPYYWIRITEENCVALEIGQNE